MRISHEVTKEEYPWIYGEDLFEDGTIIPWMRLRDDFVIGTRYREVETRDEQ